MQLDRLNFKNIKLNIKLIQSKKFANWKKYIKNKTKQKEKKNQKKLKTTKKQKNQLKLPCKRNKLNKIINKYLQQAIEAATRYKESSKLFSLFKKANVRPIVQNLHENILYLPSVRPIYFNKIFLSQEFHFCFFYRNIRKLIIDNAIITYNF